MADELREILGKFKNSDGEILFGYNGYYSCQEEKITATIIEIKSLLKEKLPKKITIEEVKSKSCPYSDKIKCCTMQDYSKNELLTEIEKVFDEL